MIQLKTIKNIIFDFGGVIYNIDHQLTKNAFRDLGIENFEQLYSHQVQSGLFEELERGEISENQFRDSLRKVLSKNFSDQQLDKAWNALLVGYKKERIDLLIQLKEQYQIFLLSNTNSIHSRQFFAELDEYVDFKSLFVDVWLSYEKKARKPERDFYQNLLEKHSLIPEETLFIDDYDVNIEAAKKLGMQTHYLLPNEDIVTLFNKWMND